MCEEIKERPERPVRPVWFPALLFGYVGPMVNCGAHWLILVSVSAHHHPLMLAGAWVARGDTTYPPKLPCRRHVSAPRSVTRAAVWLCRAHGQSGTVEGPESPPWYHLTLVCMLQCHCASQCQPNGRFATPVPAGPPARPAGRTPACPHARPPAHPHPAPPAQPARPLARPPVRPLTR